VKAAFLAERSAMTDAVVVDRAGNVTRLRGRSPRAGSSATTWKREVPPFRGDAFVAFDPAGALWIQRTTFGREGARYDVIGPDGTLIDRVMLPEGHRVVGFGRREMYVVRRDADDLEFLQRRPLSR
jgi:hypothetical protein